MLSEVEFRDGVVELIRKATTELPQDVLKALRTSRKLERNRIARLQLDCMIKNAELARKLGAPICQDTGILIFFVKLGPELQLGFNLSKTIRAAVKMATAEIPLRSNVVDPITRENRGDNTGVGQPIIHVEPTRGRKLEIDLLMKGAGSENWSRLYMLKPTEGVRGVEKVVLQTIREAGGQPCPPVIIGVGIGGSAELAPILAKKAILRSLRKKSDDPRLAGLEEKLTLKINGLNIGPMGLGGKTTALGVHVERADCHTASLPVAVNLQCWADRRAKLKLVGRRVEVL